MLTYVLLELIHFPPLFLPVLSGSVLSLLTIFYFSTAKYFMTININVNIKRKIQDSNELCITVIILSHLPLKSTYLEKYIIAYETTNRHSDFSTFLLNSIYSSIRVRVYYKFTHRGFCDESSRHTAIYIHFSILCHLSWQRLACFLGMKGVSCWRGNSVR